MRWLDKLKRNATALKAGTYALNLASSHPATPCYAKLLVAAIAEATAASFRVDGRPE